MMGLSRPGHLNRGKTLSTNREPAAIVTAMRWIKTHFLLLVIYGGFFTAVGQFVPPWIRYAGVEDWPSVPATVTGESGDSGSYRTQGSWGMQGAHFYDNRQVHFHYEVAGRKYEGDHFSPDGGGLGGPWQDYPWRAYYKPSAPEIAVLHPKPYQGMAALLWMAITGVMVAVHLYCGATDFLKGRKKARKNGGRRDPWADMCAALMVESELFGIEQRPKEVRKNQVPLA